MNNSPLRKYFGQNYGKKEDSLEARAMAANQFVDYKGQLLLKNQYDALAAVAEQYEKMPEELVDIVLESGLVRNINFWHMPIKSSNGTLTIPKEFSALRKLYCYDNQLQSLILPKELISLQELDCSRNYLQSLVLPKELTSLQVLGCSGNQLQSLDIPKELNALKILYCDGNPSLPREVLSELRSRGVAVHE